MSWTDPAAHVWTVGEIVSAASMNTYIEANLVFLGTPPTVRVTNSISQSISTAALTALTFDTERWKTDASMHSNSVNTSRLTCTVAGKYIIGASIAFQSNATGLRQFATRLNGGATYTSSLKVPAVNGDSTELVSSNVYALAVADYLECLAQQTSGGALNVLQATAFSPDFWMHWTGF